MTLSNMTPEIEDNLKFYVTNREPFGPASSSIVRDDVNARWILFNEDNKICEEYRNDPNIIVGRRGSGKTSILQNSDKVDRHSYTVFAPANDLIEFVRDSLKKSPEGTEFVEQTTKLWDVALNTYLMSDIATRSQPTQLKRVKSFLSRSGVAEGATSASFLSSLRRFGKSADQHTSGQIISAIFDFVDGGEDGYDSALVELDSFLKAQKESSVVLIDSLEDYKLSTEYRKDVMEGLLKCVGEYGNRRRQIRLCISGEYYFDIRKCSSNPLKDFEKNLLIQWVPSEIYRILAWRFLIFCRLHDIDLFNRLQRYDILKREDCLALIDMFLPKKILNGVGVEEHSISYILRHTQMMPRQIISILNKVFTKGSGMMPNYSGIANSHILEGVKECEHVLVEEIFTAFKYKFPDARKYISRSLPELPRSFADGELRIVFNHHCKKILGVRKGIDYHAFKKMLVEIGAVGRVVTDREGKVDGEFEYAQPGRLYVSADDKLCLHPIFSGVFSGQVRKERELSIVYPQQKMFETDEGRSLKVFVDTDDF